VWGVLCFFVFDSGPCIPPRLTSLLTYSNEQRTATHTHTISSSSISSSSAPRALVMSL
jgi:hypothetical protein